MKRLLAILSLLFCASCIHAQIPGFSIGPKIGFNTLKFTTDLNTIKSDPDGAFQFGAFARIGKKIYLQPEVDYVTKGGKITFGGDMVKIKLNSVTVPLLVGYRLINAGIFNIRVMAGPAISMLVDKTVPVSGLPDSFPLKSKNDIKNSMWSVQFGGGVDVLNFTLDLRYEMGIDNMYTGQSDLTMRNNLFNVSLGFKLL
jgi:hypothetical protein